MYEDGWFVSSLKSQICLDNKWELFYFRVAVYCVPGKNNSIFLLLVSENVICNSCPGWICLPFCPSAVDLIPLTISPKVCASAVRVFFLHVERGLTVTGEAGFCCAKPVKWNWLFCCVQWEISSLLQENILVRGSRKIVWKKITVETELSFFSKRSVMHVLQVRKRLKIVWECSRIVIEPGCVDKS